MPRTLPSSADDLQAHVQRNLVRRCGVRRGDKLLVGVSAGADSVALLGLLASIAPRLTLALEVAHFDHALRPESADDARFVAELAGVYGLAFHVSRWAAPRVGEAPAREARHTFLQSTARERACNAIALAHHLDDQIETAILRIERGSGLRGTGAMAWKRADNPPVVRPLLDVRRGALRAYLESTGRSWREDASNADTAMARNRIRTEVLPVLDEALRAGWMERWGAQLEELRSVSAWIDRLARDTRRAAAVPGSQDELERGPLRDAPEMVRRRALQGWLDAAWRRTGPESRRGAHKQMIRRHIEEASRIVRNGRNGQSIDLPGGWTLLLESDRVRLVGPGTGPVALAAPEYHLEVSPERGPVEPLAKHEATVAAPRGSVELPERAEARVDGAALEPPLRCRQPLPGDLVQLLGAPGRRKLARVFQDRDIPRRLRAAWPVVEDGRGIVWVPGVGVADRAKVHDGTTGALRLRVERAAPRPPGPRADLVQHAKDH